MNFYDSLRQSTANKLTVDTPYGLSKDIDVTLKECRIYVKVPIKGAPGEVLVEPCGCSFHSGERLRTCEDHTRRRLAQ